ncbi:MAG: hypothetical protein KY429_01265 [Actinobacteria bacterium]|nr:hypothetical protein [Actinomycetota bacterium]
MSSAAFALSLDRDPFVLFLVLFIAPTLYRAVASVRKTAARGPFALFALSDLLLVVAMTVRYGEGFDWSFPSSWAAGAPLVVIAGAVRLLGAARSSDAIGAFFMWQGLFLIGWASGSAAPAAALAALGLFGAALWGRRLDPLAAFGSGVALAMAAAGLPPAALAVVGLAILATMLGERVISMWVILMGPASVASSASIPDPGPIALLGAAAGFVLWAWAAGKVAVSKPSAGGRAASFLAAIGTVLIFLERSPELVLWFGYALAIASAAAFFLLKPSRVALDQLNEFISRPPERGGFAIAGWTAAGLAVLLLIRLAGLGASTGFL